MVTDWQNASSSTAWGTLNLFSAFVDATVLADEENAIDGGAGARAVDAAAAASDAKPARSGDVTALIGAHAPSLPAANAVGPAPGAADVTSTLTMIALASGGRDSLALVAAASGFGAAEGAPAIAAPTAAPRLLSDFSADFETFTGAGFDADGTAGRLSSNTWIVTGLSDGAMAFGDTKTSGDFARGPSTGGVSTGGVYAFNTGGNIILGLQPTGDDFTPGDIVLRLQNPGLSALTSIDVAYDIFFRNDQPRANALNVSYSLDGTSYVPVAAANFTTPEVADSLGWQSVARSFSLTGFSVDPAALFYLKWTGDDVSGSGSRDEYGIDNVFVSGLAPVTSPPPPPAFKLIHQVQGSGAASPLVGQKVTIEAVVVGDFQGANKLSGVFLQEEDADADADPLTSEGIFASIPDTIDVGVGQLVRLTGTVAESFGRTEITGVTDVVILGSVPLPTAATLSLPFASLDLEAFEGMRVNVVSATDARLTVTENFNLDRYGQVAVSAGRKVQPTQIFDPQDEQAEVQDLISANSLNRLTVDDDNNLSNPSNDPYVLIPPDGLAVGPGGSTIPPLTPFGPTLRIGAELNSLNGVLDYAFGEYRVRKGEALDVDETTNGGARPQTPPAVGGTLTVASFNVLNFFNGDGLGGGFPTPRGATTPEDFDRQTSKLVTALSQIKADVFGFQEIENDGFGALSAIDDLVEALNGGLNANIYAFVNAGVPAVGTDQITTALIYNKTAVRLAPGSSVEFLDDSDFPALGLDFGVPVFDGIQRPPLAASFQDLRTGEVFTVVVNHFKSKGSATSLPDDADQGDGQGFSNASRVRAAEALITWLATDPTGSGDPDQLIIGDLNSYAKEDPVATIKAAGFVDLANDVFGNPADNYSYVFSGADGTLDHALSSATLASQVTGTAEWHINADEPDLLTYSSQYNEPEFFNPNDPFAASDHDPLLVGLELGGLFSQFIGNDRGELIIGREGREILIGNGGDDRLFALAGDDRLYGGDGNDRLNGGSGNDNLEGDSGDDTLIGSDGNDRLDGGAGGDRLSTGAGFDLIVLRVGEGRDIVNDFVVGEDVILLDGLSFADVVVTAAANGAAVVAGSETLAILLGVAPDTLGFDSFLSTVDYPLI
jgi:predicted extracellular nuclease